MLGLGLADHRGAPAAKGAEMTKTGICRHRGGPTVARTGIVAAALLLGTFGTVGTAGGAGRLGRSEASVPPVAVGSISSLSQSVPGDPIRVESVKTVDPRILDVEMTTPALPGPVHVDVMLPTGYSAHPNRRYPVIYFLHGGSAGPNTGIEYQSWIDNGDAEQITTHRQVIGVFPEAGSGGWYTNWYNNGAGGPPEWETFHVDQLVPWIDHGFRTVADRGGRALIGLSMGGYGVMEYAARFPDVFGTAASFSGAVDIDDPPDVAGPLASLIVGVMAQGYNGDATGPFGSIDSNEIVWRNHDPADLIENLRHTNLYLYSGNGTPGPLDTGTTATSFTEFIESVVFRSTTYFVGEMKQLHIPGYVDLYGNGTHSWPYWQRDLRSVLPMVMSDFTHPSSVPRDVTYTTADPVYSTFGWTVGMHRAVEEFSTLSTVGAHELTLKGSGAAQVTTPAHFRPGSAHRVVMSGSTGRTRTTVRADSAGRLVLNVNLGPSNETTEYAPGWTPSDTKVYVTSVEIT